MLKLFLFFAPSLLLWGAQHFDTLDVHDTTHALETQKTLDSATQGQTSSGETLGDYLQEENFVDSATYGAGVGRPVMKGMEGYRVGITQGNIILNDLSAMSQDHAVGVSPASTQSIELIKGPASLLYGSYSAGVISVKGQEHDPLMLASGITMNGDLSYGTNALTQKALLSLGASDGNRSLYGTLFYHKSDDYASGGTLVEESDTFTLQGHLVGEYKLGETHLFKPYVDMLRNDYGIPNSTSEATRIDMSQQRGGMVWHIDTSTPLIDHIWTDVQYSHYRHYETEGRRYDGLFEQNQFALSSMVGLDVEEWHTDIHMTFGNNHLQVCHEHGQCTQFESASRTGATHGTSLLANPSIEGLLPFSHDHPMPNTTQNEASLAFSTKRVYAENELSMAYRAQLRHLAIDASNISESWLVPASIDSDYYRDSLDVAHSLSLGWLEYLSSALSIQSSAGYIERIPSAQELLWNGFHHATHSYIFGNRDLSAERSLHVDTQLLVDYAPFSTQLSAFGYGFFNYIHQASVADANGSLLVDPWHHSSAWAMQQQRALIAGVALTQHFEEHYKAHRIELDASVELIRGIFSDGSNIPRMTPNSATLLAIYGYGDFEMRASYKRVDESRFLGLYESFTSAYDWVSLQAHWEQKEPFGVLKYYLNAQNLTDAIAYNHLSFLKETAPLIGRTITLGLAYTY
ncbi:MAG: hypothetical protein KU37_09665 [Sulfuricurvum sp. PC08-66]|nr:MAG: hypothetical protein KU37_09665 [Sulfuricurvum sp. PC08-66]